MKVMIARDTRFSDLVIDQESGYDEWLCGKVNKTMERVASGKTKLHAHADAMSILKRRLEARRHKTA